MMKEMYKGIVNSPITSLSEDIGAKDTDIKVVDSSYLPAAPNLAVIGTEGTAETIKYAGINENILTGCTRGFQGTAKAWAKDTLIARNFTEYDLATVQENITTLDIEKASNQEFTEFKGNIQNQLDEHEAQAEANLKNYAKKTDLSAAETRLDKKIDVKVSNTTFEDFKNTNKIELDKKTNDADLEVYKKEVTSNLAKKVDKVSGKGLSTNDYTDLEKAEVAKIKEKAESRHSHSGTEIWTDKNGDWVLLNEHLEKKADITYVDEQVAQAGKVGSVNGKTGIVVLGANDIRMPDGNAVSYTVNRKADKTDLDLKIDKTSITSDLTGIDETKVLSQKAGSLLFQNVDNGKGYIANAIIDLDNEVEVSNESTFTELGDAITNNLKAKPIIYGFEIDENNSNPKTAVTYIGDNINHTPMRVSNYGSWEKFIKKISTPVLLKNGEVQYELQHEDFTKKANGSSSILTGADGDVMIKFKHLWVKEEKVSSTKRKVYLSTGKFDGATSYTKMTEKGYNQLSWGLLMTLQHLYLLLYKDRDSQTALGRGYVDDNDDFTSTGGTNTKPYFFGETTGKQQMKFCGIESFWDNKYNWIDGIVSDSNYDLKIGYTNFNDSGSGYKLIKTPMTRDVSGHVKSTMGGEVGYILTDNAGSSSTGYCDYGGVSAVSVAHFGGFRSFGDYPGAFHVRLYNSASYSIPYYGARLCFVDDDYFYVGAYTGYVEGSKLRSISGKIPTGDKKIGEFRTYAQNNN